MLYVRCSTSTPKLEFSPRFRCISLQVSMAPLRLRADVSASGMRLAIRHLGQSRSAAQPERGRARLADRPAAFAALTRRPRASLRAGRCDWRRDGWYIRVSGIHNRSPARRHDCRWPSSRRHFLARRTFGSGTALPNGRGPARQRQSAHFANDGVLGCAKAAADLRRRMRFVPELPQRSHGLSGPVIACVVPSHGTLLFLGLLVKL